MVPPVSSADMWFRSCSSGASRWLGSTTSRSTAPSKGPTTLTRPIVLSRATAAIRHCSTTSSSAAEHFIAGAAMIGGISYFHTHSYDLVANNERIMAASVDAALAAHRNGQLRKVTYMSSSMVYESTDHWPSFEGDELKVPPPVSSYGFQKLAVEYFARAAWDQYELPYTIVRPFNCVGVGEGRALGDVEILSGNVKLAMSHVVPDLVQKVLLGQDPLHILGDGTQVRHYTYGRDLARGIVIAMGHDAAVNEDFNLSTAISSTVLDVAGTDLAEGQRPRSSLPFCERPAVRTRCGQTDTVGRKGQAAAWVRGDYDAQ